MRLVEEEQAILQTYDYNSTVSKCPKNNRHSARYHPGAFDRLTCPHPREFAILKKMLMPGGWPGGGMGTAGID